MRDVLLTRPTVVSVGLDYHQDSVQVCILNSAGDILCNRPVRNRAEEIVELVRRYAPFARVGVESCCGAASLADSLIALTGWEVRLGHPGYVKRMRQNPDKTDFSDAHLVADLMRVNYLPFVWLAPLAIRDLRQLVRYRQQLVAQKVAVKLRIRALLREMRIEAATAKLWTKAGRQWLKGNVPLPPQSRWVLDQHVEDMERLEQKLSAVGKELETAAAADSMIVQLQTHKGIGLVTACVMRAEIGWVSRFNSGRQLSRFCGLSPRNASSGKRQADAGLIQGCSKLLRAILIEAAHRLMRYEGRWKNMTVQMKERGKPTSVIAAAVANRWIRGLYYELRHEPALAAAA